MLPKRRVAPDFKPHRLGLEQVLGELEAEIMETLWLVGETTVREVHHALLKGRDIAYTTVMTVMARLADKGILLREADGNAYLYRPSMSREAFISAMVGEVLDALLSSHSTQTVSHFMARLDKANPAELQALEELIKIRKGG